MSFTNPSEALAKIPLGTKFAVRAPRPAGQFGRPDEILRPGEDTNEWTHEQFLAAIGSGALPQGRSFKLCPIVNGRVSTRRIELVLDDTSTTVETGVQGASDGGGSGDGVGARMQAEVVSMAFLAADRHISRLEGELGDLKDELTEVREENALLSARVKDLEHAAKIVELTKDQSGDLNITLNQAIGNMIKGPLAEAVVKDRLVSMGLISK